MKRMAEIMQIVAAIVACAALGFCLVQFIEIVQLHHQIIRQARDIGQKADAIGWSTEKR